MADVRLRRDERLRSGGDYRRVFRKGIRLDGALFLLVAGENQRGHVRLGLAAGRRLGGATDRNRVKRFLREAFRRNKIEGGVDLILVPKPEIVQRSFAEVEREYRERLRRLAARVAKRRGPRPPVPD